MVKSSSNQELFKIITSAYSSIIVIMELSDCLDKSSKLTVHDFFSQIAKTHLHGKHQDPFNPGVFLMSSYLSLVLGKEKWKKILPDVPAKSSPEEWVICKCKFSDSKKTDPSLKEVIHRMRNGFAHGHIDCNVPRDPNSMSKKDLLRNTMFTIKDGSNKSKKGTFSIEISALNLWSLNVTYFNKIGEHEELNLKQCK